MLDPILQRVMAQEHEVDYLKIDTDKATDLAAKYKVGLACYLSPCLSKTSKDDITTTHLPFYLRYLCLFLYSFCPVPSEKAGYEGGKG